MKDKKIIWLVSMFFSLLRIFYSEFFAVPYARPLWGWIDFCFITTSCFIAILWTTSKDEDISKTVLAPIVTYSIICSASLSVYLYLRFYFDDSLIIELREKVRDEFSKEGVPNDTVESIIGFMSPWSIGAVSCLNSLLYFTLTIPVEFLLIYVYKKRWKMKSEIQND